MDFATVTKKSLKKKLIKIYSFIIPENDRLIT